MDYAVFSRQASERPLNSTPDPMRIEAQATNIIGGDFKVILLDADDSFDIIIENPDTGRQILYSMLKGPER